MPPPRLRRNKVLGVTNYRTLAHAFPVRIVVGEGPKHMGEAGGGLKTAHDAKHFVSIKFERTKLLCL